MTDPHSGSSVIRHSSKHMTATASNTVWLFEITLLLHIIQFNPKHYQQRIICILENRKKRYVRGQWLQQRVAKKNELPGVS